MRKLTSLIAAAGIAAALAAGSSAVAPSSAEARACSWQMPSTATIVQGNNHRAYLKYDRGSRIWKAKAYSNGEHRTSSSEVAFRSFTPRLVKFIITWYDETGGIYTGTIDSDGFVSGTTRDRWNPSSKTSWYMTQRARCA